jgi:solute:Na+ symporter, SSS family
MTIRGFDLSVVIVYFIGVTLIGLYWSKRNKSTTEYFLGNRSFGAWVIGLSMIGTSISAVTFLAFPGDTYKTAWLRIIGNFGIIAGTIVAAVLYIPFFRGSGATTAYQFIEGRWGKSVRAYGAASFLPGQLMRLCTILYLLSQLVHTLTSVPMWICVIAAGIFVSFYTIVGGIEAVIWTDVVQTLVLILGGIMIMVVIIMALPGGLMQIFEVALRDNKLSFSEMMPDGSLHPASWRFSLSEKTALMMLLTGILGWIDQLAANQNVVQRYCAASSTKEARKATWLTMFMSLPIWMYFAFIGTSLYVFFQVYPDGVAFDILTGANNAKAEEILPYFALHYLPVGIAGLVVAAALAAAMSSLDSSINAISTVTIVDIYKAYMVKDRDDAHYLRVAKWIAVVSSIIMILGALVLVWTPTKTLQDTLAKIGGFIGGGLFIIFLLGLFTKIGNARSFFWGLAALYIFKIWVFIGTVGWIPIEYMPPVDLYYLGLTGEILGIAVCILVYYLGKRPERDLTGLTLWTSPWIWRKDQEGTAEETAATLSA